MICPRCGCSMIYFDESDFLGEHWLCLSCSGDDNKVVMIFPKESFRGSTVCGRWCEHGYGDSRSCDLCREDPSLIKKFLKECPH